MASSSGTTSTTGTASTARAGHPRRKSSSWVGDVVLHSQSGLEDAAQPHQGIIPDVSGEPAGIGHRPGGGLASAASAELSPRGLSGLARVVAKDATTLIALLAAASACEEAGVFEPVDLALAGSGDQLPPEVAGEILSGCLVPGATEALESLFQVSRKGLRGTISLTSRRLALQCGGHREVQPETDPRGHPLSRSEKRALSAVTRPDQKKREEAQRPPAASGSLREKETNKFVAAVGRCFAFLEDIGESSPRFTKMKEAKERGVRGPLVLQEKAFISNFSSPKSLDSARRRMEQFLLFFRGAGLDPFAPSEWDVAAWVTDQRGESGPRRALQALAWAERALDLNLCASTSLVRSQRTASFSAKPAEPKQARMATVDMVRRMEQLVTEAPSLLFRVWAGVFACMGHGCLRWADAQHSESIVLTKDAVFGVSWKMKGKKVYTPWAALRQGFANVDWASSWWDALQEAGLPGKDFLVWAPAPLWSGFSERIAEWHDAQAVLRSLLVISGLPLADAMQYSCHSWRHLYPTAGRQLDLDAAQLETLGHWEPGSTMPARYDQKACVSELLQKAKIVTAVAQGWKIAEPGCMPQKPTGASASGSTSKQVQKRARICTPAPKESKAICWVLHAKRQRVHGWAGGLYTLCRQWRCGEREDPAQDALFFDLGSASLASGEACRSCTSQHGCVIFPEQAQTMRPTSGSSGSWASSRSSSTSTASTS